MDGDLAGHVALVGEEDVDEALGVVGVGALLPRATVVDEERGAPAGELDEVYEVQADGAVLGGVGHFEKMDEGRSAFFAMEAGDYAILVSGIGVFQVASSVEGHVSL